jgi:hypothetical protein
MTNKHLAKAKDYIGKGEAYYRKAAGEIKAALNEGATQREVATYLGRDQSWVGRLVKWSTSDADPKQTPFAEPRGGAREASTARKVLERSTPEQIKQVLSDLPPEQIEALQTVAQDVAWEQSDADGGRLLSR